MKSLSLSIILCLTFIGCTDTAKTTRAMQEIFPEYEVIPLPQDPSIYMLQQDGIVWSVQTPNYQLIAKRDKEEIRKTAITVFPPQFVPINSNDKPLQCICPSSKPQED